MAKKILAAVVSAVMLVCLAGCSGNYVMTEEDMAVQKSIEGRWIADDSTGYNEYDGNGNFLALTAVEFTSDYKYLIHVCMPGDGQASGYVMTYDPVAYSFKDKMFRVDIDGVASYARVSVSEDGQTLFWITDDQTDRYNRLTDEQAAELGIPEYDPAAWEETETATESESGTEENSENGEVTESETGMVSENEEEAAPVINSDIDVSKLNFDRSVKFSSGSDVDKAPVLLWESEDGETAFFGMYLYEREPYIFIEHDGVIDTFEQDWLTPRNIEPRFEFGDFDGDGAEELAAVYYVGSGTGASIEQLVIYEKAADGSFTENKFVSPENILNEKLTAVEIDEENTSVMFTFDGETVTADYSGTMEITNDFISRYDADNEVKFCFGDIISYDFEGDKIVMNAGLGLMTVYYPANVTADVEYKDGSFTLTNIEITTEE